MEANGIYGFLRRRVNHTAINIPSSARLYHQKSEAFNVIINLPLFVIRDSLQGCQ